MISSLAVRKRPLNRRPITSIVYSGNHRPRGPSKAPGSLTQYVRTALKILKRCKERDFLRIVSKAGHFYPLSRIQSQKRIGLFARRENEHDPRLEFKNWEQALIFVEKNKRSGLIFRLRANKNVIEVTIEREDGSQDG
ncbi:hypothetical protein GF382_01575 [Candidatus Falkowbacteria bacterium]|nr:hypothetical protein [Candidatus Falkowbacteria bacterium]